MPISTLIHFARAQLTSSSSPGLDAEILLAFVLKQNRAYLEAHPETLISPENEKHFLELISARARGTPVAYLTHTKEFYGLDFYVDENVLIPRPETELLIETVLNFATQIPEASRIIDVGTGSGCIAVTLAKHLPRYSLIATDLSAPALAVARRNAEQHGVKIRFFESDLLEKIPDTPDIIVANLPYIGESKYRIIDPNVEQYEPALALFGGADGLVLYERLFRQITVREKLPRLILLELNPEQKDATQKLVTQIFGAQFEIEFLHDLAGRVRVIKLVSRESY